MFIEINSCSYALQTHTHINTQVECKKGTHSEIDMKDRVRFRYFSCEAAGKMWTSGSGKNM